MSASFVHETAIVDEGVELGDGTKVWHWVHISKGSQIGQNCVLGQNVFVGNDVRIGNGVKVQNNVSVYNGVVLEDDVFCGPSMVFTNVINPRSHIERKTEFKETRVSKGATLGANCTILCGNQIGPYAMVAAGAVVSKNVPAYALVMGVPARHVGWVCACGERLDMETGTSDSCTCKACGKNYKADGYSCSEV